MRHLYLCAIAVLALSTGPLSADSEKVCDDLYKLSCAPGDFDDGTGVAHSPDDAQTKAISEKNSAIAYERLKEALQKPENKYLRKIALSATGLTAAPQCDGAETAPSEDCLNRMSKGSSDILVRFVNGIVPSLTPQEVQQGKLKDAHYLIMSDEFIRIRDEILANARSTVKDDKTQQRIAENIFPKVQQMLRDKISGLVTDPELREKFTDKIDAIHFKGDDCTTPQTKNSIASVLMSNAFYDPSNNSFKYCAAFNTTTSSEYSMAFVIAHELCHSMDPCGVTMGPSDYAFHYKPNINRKQAEAEFPIGKNVLNCLRQPTSVNATANPFGPMAYSAPTVAGVQVPIDYGGNGLGYPPTSPYAVDPSLNAFTSFCDKDQITESFADWCANEILPDYMAKYQPELKLDQKRIGYSNVFRIMCYPTEPQGFDTHPLARLRANALTLVQPKVREQMGCKRPPVDYTYCPPNSPAPEDKPTQNDPSMKLNFGNPISLPKTIEPGKSSK